VRPRGGEHGPQFCSPDEKGGNRLGTTKENKSEEEGVRRVASVAGEKNFTKRRAIRRKVTRDEGKKGRDVNYKSAGR